MIDAAAEATQIEKRCRAAGNAERAVGEKAYLKSDLEHFGAGVGAIRSVVKDFAASHTDLSHGELVALVQALWSMPIHECRMSAMMLLDRYSRLLDRDDLALIENMIRGSRTWAYVDDLSGHVAGALYVRFPDLGSQFDRWSVDPNFWIRRSALLALLVPLKQGAPIDQFARYADTMLDEKEFFIRKAIGWVLRDVSKRRPDEVYAWLLPRAGRASGVTLREAVKYLTPEQRETILREAQPRRVRRASSPPASRAR